MGFGHAGTNFPQLTLYPAMDKSLSTRDWPYMRTRISPEELARMEAAIKKLAKKSGTGLSMADFIRVAVHQRLERIEKEK